MQVQNQTQDLEALDCRLFLAPCHLPMPGPCWWGLDSELNITSTRLQDHLPPWTTTKLDSAE